MKVVKDNSRAAYRAVGKLIQREVLVGIPAEGAERSASTGKRTPLNNATIGYLMEMGVPEKNIPARPFLAPGVADVQDELVAQLRTAAIAALSGDTAGADKALHGAGLKAQASVKQKILTGPFAPLSERTLQARARRRTEGGKLSKSATSVQARKELRARAKGALPSTDAKPLYDTHSLHKSINYVVRKREANDKHN